MAAEAGLPQVQFSLGCSLDFGEGVATPDHAAAADWFKRAIDAGHGDSGMAEKHLSAMYTVGRGRATQILPASFSSSLSTLFPWVH
jgi:TPR repeat protein